MRRACWILVVVCACDKGAPSKPAPAPVPAPRDAAATADAASTEHGDVMIRACNKTTYDFQAVTFHRFDAPALAKGACTPYHAVDHAYHYTNLKFRIGSDDFEIQPTDYVGEPLLRAGPWSYDITISDYSTRRADIRARRERPAGAKPIRVRVCNDSRFDLMEAWVANVPTSGALKPHACTAYEANNDASTLVAAQVIVDSSSVSVSPPEPFVEQDLEPGTYTFRLDIVTKPKRALKLERVRDPD